MSKNSWLLFLFFLLGLGLLAYSFFPTLKQNWYLLDFSLYYYPASQNLRLGLNPYQAPRPLLSPPLFLVVILPLAYFSPIPGQIVWSALSFLALLGSLWLLIKLSQLQPKLHWFLLLTPFLILSFPVKFTLGMGQINHFILLLFTLGFYYYSRRFFNLSALFLSLSLMIKLTPAWVILFFIIKKDWRYLTRLFWFSCLELLLCCLLLPSGTVRDFFRFVLPTYFQHTANSSYYNQALTGLISRSFPAWWQTPLYLVFSLSLVILSLRKLARLPEVLQFSLLVVLSILLAPVSWQHHLVFLFFPLLILLAYPRYRLLTLISFSLIFINFASPPPLLASHATLGSLLLYGIITHAKNLNLSSSALAAKS